MQRVAEVVVRLRVAGTQLDRARAARHRGRRVARIAQRVAEVVVRLRIVRTQRHRAAIVRDRVVEPAAFAQHVAEVVEVRRVRPLDERLLHQRDPRVVLLELACEQPEEMQRVRLARLRGEDRVVQRLRFGEAPRLMMRERGLQSVVNIVHASFAVSV
ncbi:hypothetical protein BGV49_05050 [Burkholderia ubonensis]|nr:hypothetical protein BGV49_05050 [Burkholderia ubonensis]